MKPDQAKLVGGALGVIIPWLWGMMAVKIGWPEMPAEVGAAWSVLCVAVADYWLRATEPRVDNKEKVNG